jgi:hypothetical protein
MTGPLAQTISPETSRMKGIRKQEASTYAAYKATQPTTRGRCIYILY